MSKVYATAPGKIILFGEHAVVYGRPAIAIPITKRTAQASLQPFSKSAFQLIAPDLQKNQPLSTLPDDDPLVKIIHLTLQQLNQSLPTHTALHIQATLPLGRGLGSGAAVSTAIVRSFARFFNQPLTNDEVSTLVYEVEKLYHGTPSGIDNSVIAYEQPVYFIKGRPIQRLQVKYGFTMVIADTGIIAPTHQVVGDLRQRWQTNPTMYEGYFDEISTLTRQAKMMLEQGRVEIAHLGKLMNENHELLMAIGVSSSTLNQLVVAAKEAGAWGAKLSGAGWGGNIIALTAPEMAETIAHALHQAGAVETIITSVTGQVD